MARFRCHTWRTSGSKGESETCHSYCLYPGGEECQERNGNGENVTSNYHLLIQWCRTPEQRLYEQVRPEMEGKLRPEVHLIYATYLQL